MLFHRKIQSSWFVWTSERSYKNSATLGSIEQETSYKVREGVKIVAFSSPSSFIDASVAGHNPTELSTDGQRKFKDSTGSRCNLWLANPARAIVHAKPTRGKTQINRDFPARGFPRSVKAPYGYFLQDLNWCVFVMIGQRDYSDYRFTSLNCISLYSNLLDLPLLQFVPFSLGYHYIPRHPALPWLRGCLVLRKQWYQPVFIEKDTASLQICVVCQTQNSQLSERGLVVLKRIWILFG